MFNSVERLQVDVIKKPLIYFQFKEKIIVKPFRALSIARIIINVIIIFSIIHKSPGQYSSLLPLFYDDVPREKGLS